MLKLLFILGLLLLPFVSSGQSRQDTPLLTFAEFQRRSLQRYLPYLAEQVEVSAAEAAAQAARVFEDPEIELILPRFERDEFAGAPRNLAVELSIPIELGRKRQRRVDVALRERNLARIHLEEVLLELRADLLHLYIEGVRVEQVLEVMEDTRQHLSTLLTLTESLLEAGEISAVDVRLTRIETRSFEADYLEVRAELEALRGEVAAYWGEAEPPPFRFDATFMPGLDVQTLEQASERAALRPGVRLAQAELQVREAERRLLRAERVPTLNLIAGYHNEEAQSPLPGARAAYAGISLPLRFSSLNRASLREVDLRVTQADLLAQHARHQARSEAAIGWNRLERARERLNVFTADLLEDAREVREAVLYSYQRGQASLFHVLEAQRSYNELYASYFDARAAYHRALSDLGKVSGTLDPRE